MKRLFKNYRFASGCVAMALAMGLSPAARAEEHGKLRVPANLPVPMLSDIATTDYAEVKTESGVAGEVELVRERYLDGKVKIERQVTLNGDGNYVNHGAWKMYSQAGDVIAEGQYTFGERTGMWTRWNGRKDSATLNEYPMNNFKAPFMSQATFTNGKIDGDWVITDANDRKVMLIQFKDGQRNGTVTTWLPNGKVMKQLTYLNGTPVGDLLEINKAGEIARTATYEEGHKIVTKTNYFPGSKKKQSEIMYLAAKTVETSADDFWVCQRQAGKGRLLCAGQEERHVHLLAREWPGGFDRRVQGRPGRWHLDLVARQRPEVGRRQVYARQLHRRMALVG
jgi:antitoxin component YwqK of YwqJK toxin-antitoxin module